jgi:hypothetical protein
LKNNTASGKGIYSEPVDNADQTLDDAEFHYAIIGKSHPAKKFSPTRRRAIVTSSSMNARKRSTGLTASLSLVSSCQMITASSSPKVTPLQTGDLKTFDTGLPDMRF